MVHHIACLNLFIFTCAQIVGASTNYGTLPKGNYSTPSPIESNSLGQLFSMAEGFVNIVLPTIDTLIAFISPALESNTDVMSYISTNWQKLLAMEGGFLACVVFGILFIIFVPICGMLVCCCRCCCGNCGGIMKQSERRSKSCWRNCFCGTLIVLSIFMLIPTIFIFLTNSWITNILSVIPRDSVVIFDNGVKYIDNVENQLDYVLTQYDSLNAKLRHVINEIPETAGSETMKLANELANPSFNQFDVVIEHVDNLKTNISNVNTKLQNLIQNAAVLEGSLKNQSNKMQDGLTGCFASDEYCALVYNSSKTLQIQVDMTELQELSNRTEKVTESLNTTNLTDIREEFDKILNGISNRVINETSSVVETATAELGKANTTIQSLKTQIPVGQLTNAKNLLRSIPDNITTYVESYQNDFDKYRYIAGVILALILLAIVLFYFVGIFCGTCGYNRKDDPCERSSLSHSGGISLMCGAVLSFLFSWIFMIFVLITFTIGSHLERYVCQPFSSPYNGIQLLEENFSILNISAMLGVSANVKVAGLLRQCEDDKSLYIALDLSSIIDIDQTAKDVKSQLDLSQYLDTLNNSSFDVNIYNDDIKNKLDSVNSTGFSQDLENFNLKISNLTEPSLVEYAKFLNESADKYDPMYSAEAGKTRQYSYEIKQIQINHVDKLQRELDEMSVLINGIKTGREATLNSVILLQENLIKLDEQIKENSTQLIVDAVTPVTNNITGVAVEFIDWLVLQIKGEFGACKPVSDMYALILKLICNFLIDTMNGLWFSLGWCVFFLIPSAIVAVKLSKFYRRMIYDEGGESTYLDDLQMERVFK